MHRPRGKGRRVRLLTCEEWSEWHMVRRTREGLRWGPSGVYVCVCVRWAMPRGTLEGKGPQRRPQQRLGRRLEEVAEAVGDGYCRLHMPLRLALGIGGTVARHRLCANNVGGGGFHCVPCHAPRARAVYEGAYGPVHMGRVHERGSLSRAERTLVCLVELCGATPPPPALPAVYETGPRGPPDARLRKVPGDRDGLRFVKQGTSLGVLMPPHL